MALRLMRGRPSGRIVNITSVAVPLRRRETVHAASKSAETSRDRSSRPHIVATPSVRSIRRRRPLQSRPQLQAILDAQAVHRWAEIEDVVNVVDFFVRPESGMVTGQVIYLGGVS
jgi:3-oxoacyl-[acyl-carrier protein] reductase